MLERRLVIIGMILASILVAIPGLIALSIFEPVDSRIISFTLMLIFINIAIGPLCYLLLAPRGLRGIAFMLAGVVAIASLFQFIALYLNGKRDTQSERIHEVDILKKKVNVTRGTSVHILTVSLWKDYRGLKRDIIVDASIHKKIKTGGHIQVITKPGRFGIEWIVGVRAIKYKDLL